MDRLKKIILICEQFTQSPRWAYKVTLLCLFTSLFLAFPSYENLDLNGGRLRVVANQKQDITSIRNETRALGNNKLAFRLFVPLTARLLHLNMIGCLVMQFLAGVILFYLIARIAEDVTHDRVIAMLTGLAVATIFAGVTSFVDLRGVFDGIALCLLMAAMWFRSPPLIALTVFCAAWTDERAFIASGFLFLWWAMRDSEPDNLRFTSFFKLRPLAVVAGSAAYLLGRFYVGSKYGLVAQTDGISLTKYLNNAPMGIWTALEGAWIPVLLAAYILYREKKWLEGGLYLAVMCALILAAISVIDMTRSMTYLLPALPISLAVLRSHKRSYDLRFIMLAAAIICILWPTYYAEGKNTIWWFWPLPMQVLRWVFIK